MARYLKRRKRGWYFVMDIPAEHRVEFGKVRLEVTLRTRDERLAEAKAKKLAGEFKLRFLALSGNPEASRVVERSEYQRAFEEVQALPRNMKDDDVDLAVDLRIDAILDNAPTPRFPTCEEEDGPELTDLQEARLAGLADGRSVRTGAAPRYKEQFEPAFNELANRWLEGWKAAPGRRPSNTGSQYAAAIRLFHEFWGDRPLRGVTQRDAAEFVELLKRLPPNHGRGQLSGVSLEDAVELWVGKGPGLSTPSIKRHLGVLKQVWAWGKPLGYCTGEDPFQVKLMKHRKKPSLGWETPDLQRLFADPPRRRDIYEAFYIAMFTGLRVHEIADLTWGQVRTEQGVDYLLIQDAKTEAGSRKVPVHSRLSWLLRKPRGDDTDPVFPTFSPEGPRRSRGGDASKLFGAWKKKLGVAPRRYVFHSARKNVTRIMEENAIPANVWARIIGHEPGFTYSVYNPAGLSFQNAKKTIELIDYPDVSMPSPEELYGDEARLKKAA